MRSAALFALLALALPGRAADPGPLAAVPAGANAVLVVEKPRALFEGLRGFKAYEAARKLPIFAELFAGPQAKQFEALVGYYEQDLGAEWPELLDRLAGNGLAVASKLYAGDDDAPALLVVRGRDAAATARFVELARRVIADELAKQAEGGEAPKLEAADYHGVATLKLGDKFHAAHADADLYVANDRATLTKALDLRRGVPGVTPIAAHAGPKAARALVSEAGPAPLAWLWVDIAEAKQSAAGKDFFANTKKEITQTLVLGSTIDAVRRADFVAAGLHAAADRLALSVRLPAPRAGLPPEFALHAPAAGAPGSLPPLAPPGVLYSQSFYLDLATLWKQRKSLFNEQALKDVEQFDKDVSPFLPGPSFGKLLEMSGPYHRLVAVAPPADKLYAKTPDDVIPATAVVSTMRDPTFGKAIATALRAGAAVGALKYGLKMDESTHEGVNIVTYRFDEKKPSEDDPDNFRFHFAPGFAVAGNTVIVASRPDLLKTLITAVKAEAKAVAVDVGETARANSPVWQARAFGPAAGALVKQNPETLVSNLILTRGTPLADAQTQVAALAAWLATTGQAAMTIDHAANYYEFKLSWNLK